MIRLLLIVLMFAVEIFAIYVAVFVKDYAIRSHQREVLLLQHTPHVFFLERLWAAILIATLLSGICIGIVFIIKKTTSKLIRYSVWKIFLWQWLVLFVAVLIGLVIDLASLYPYAHPLECALKNTGLLSVP